jgi:hypothetical protein
MLRPRPLGQSVFVSSPIWGPRADFHYCQTTAGYLNWGTLSDKEGVSVVYNCYWSSPAQSFWSPSRVGHMTILYCLSFVTPTTWRARSLYLYPAETGWPNYTPGTEFPLRRLLRLAGLRWRYSNPPPYGEATAYAILYYVVLDRRSVGQSLLVSIYRFETDCTENTVSNNSFVFAWVCVAANVFTEPLPKNGQFLLAQLFRHFSCHVTKLIFKMKLCSGSEYDEMAHFWGEGFLCELSRS